MNREAIEKILPHRAPMLLLDEAEVTPEGKAWASCYIKGDEFFLQGHYPGNPVVPGVILCEMMAQTCAILLVEEIQNGVPYFSGIQKAFFKRKVEPGETVEFCCEIKRKLGHFYFAAGEGRVNGEVCITGEFSVAIVSRT